MPSSTWPKLEEVETQVKAHTATNQPRELKLIEALLNTYLAALSGLRSPDLRSELHDAWVLLVTRSFNSMRCAYDLLQAGYYSQAITLVRSVNEDWFTCSDCRYEEYTRKALLYGGQMPGFEKMALRKVGSEQEREQKRNQYRVYRRLSTVAHSRPEALRVLVDPESGVVRLGGHYDRDLFVGFGYFLVGAILRMMEFLAEVLRQGSQSVDNRALQLMDEARAWMREVEAPLREVGRVPARGVGGAITHELAAGTGSSSRLGRSEGAIAKDLSLSRSLVSKNHTLVARAARRHLP